MTMRTGPELRTPDSAKPMTMKAIMMPTRAATFLLLLWISSPTTSFLLSPPLTTTPQIIEPSSSVLNAGTDVSDLLYQEQEKIIVQRGELEETFVTNTKPLEASKIKIRGAGESNRLNMFIMRYYIADALTMHKHHT